MIIDELVAAGNVARRFDWLLHAANRMEIDGPAGRVTVRGTNGEARVTFLAPAGLAFQQDDQFDAPAIYWRKGRNFPLPNQWHLKATPPPAPRVRFVTVVQVGKPGAATPGPRLVGGAAEVAGWRVLLPPGGDRLSISRAP